MAVTSSEIAPPTLSIICHAYNHAPFIGQALDSFINQRVDFPIEIIVHDDASTDGTADIIREYAERFPEVIKPVFQQENQYSQGRRAFSFTMPVARGEYIALCEGDDYWQDPDKLMKQVHFLARNPEYVVCYHNASILEGERTRPELKMKAKGCRDYSAAELRKGAWMLTLTMCFRNVLRDVPEEQSGIVNADIFLSSRLGFFGKGKFLDDIQPAVYRVHSGGVWSSKSYQEQCICNATSFYWIGVYHSREGHRRLARYFTLKAAECLLKGISGRGFPLLSGIGLAFKALFGAASRR